MKTPFLLLAAAAMLPFFYACSDSDDTPAPPDTEEQPDPEPPTPEPEQDTTGPYKIGDYYKQGEVEGIVFHTRGEEGLQGMIVSLQEGDALQWALDFTVTEAANSSNGVSNEEVIHSIAGWEDFFPAFRWCAEFNKTAGGGWYIPSVNELQTLYSNFTGISDLNRGNFNAQLTRYGGKSITSSGYWSSTECSHAGASNVNFTDGGTSCGIKTTPSKVRAVHTF